MAQTGKQYLFLSDFDQTLSFNDSGLVFSKLLGIDNFDKRVVLLCYKRRAQQKGQCGSWVRRKRASLIRRVAIEVGIMPLGPDAASRGV